MPDDPRPRLRRRFFASLVLIGLLVGMMIGRLVTPEPVRLLRVEPQAQGLDLWFDRQPELYEEHLDGAFALLLQAKGEAAAGQLATADGRVAWRVQRSEQGLLVHFVATRPLRGEWSGEERDGAWRLAVRLSVR